MNDPLIKQRLLEYCHHYVDDRVTNSTLAMDAAQSAANEEGKSSAGDKYETGRAMAQIERDKAAHQLGEALKLKQVLNQIDPTQNHHTVQIGSVVSTPSFLIFIAIGIGKVNFEGRDCLIIAPQSPLGKGTIGKSEGQTLSINGQSHAINRIV